jgi:hypothetical protein
VNVAAVLMGKESSIIATDTNTIEDLHNTMEALNVNYKFYAYFMVVANIHRKRGLRRRCSFRSEFF